MKTLKEKLRDRDKLSGMHICLTEPCISEMCAGLGYDFLWIDTEHTAIDYQVLLYHLMGAKAGGTDTLVRIPWNNQVLAKRVLEMGPTGIIIPMVNTAQELDAAMQATLYPPYGIRGFGPLRAVRYGLDDADSFIASSRQQLVRCVQIETKTAVRNLKEMVRNPYVDCFILGSCDLSGSIGELNRVFEQIPAVWLMRRWQSSMRAESLPAYPQAVMIRKSSATGTKRALTSYPQVPIMYISWTEPGEN